MKLKNITIIILTILILSLLSTSCCSKVSYVDDLEDDLPLRVYLLANDRLDQLILRDYARSFNYIVSSRFLETTMFDDAETMYDQIVNEIYTGGGPDIIVINSFSSRYIDLYKTSQQNAFADMDILIQNSNSFDLDDYNSLAMDTGIINGKRIMMPMGYNINYSVGMQECFDYYKIEIPDKLTLSTYLDTIEEYYSKTKMPVLLGIDEACLLSQFFDMGKTIEKTDELRRLLDILKEESERKKDFQLIDLHNSEWIEKFIEAHDWVYKNNFLFIDQVGQNESLPTRRFHLHYNVIETYWNHRMIWFPQPIRENQPVKAYVEYGFAINNNSKHKNEAFEFIKFVLSDFKQTTTNIINNPVLKESFEIRKLEFESGLNISYGDLWGIGGLGVHPDYIPDEKFVPEEMEEELIDYIESPEDFIYIGQFKYIYYNIMQSSIEEYYKGYITYDELIDEINNKLMIYYSE